MVLEWISHHFGAIPNPHLLIIKSRRWYLFKTNRKSYGETHDSLKIVNQKGCFLQNILKSIFFWLRPFSGLKLRISSLLITFYFIVNRLTEGNVQNQAKELCVLRYNILVPFLFLLHVLIFISLCFFFVYVIICLFRLGFLCLFILSILGY